MDAMQTGEPVAGAFDASVIRAEFERAVERAPSMSLLLLSTSDGRVISDWSRSDIDPRRLAAMTNSLLTLGETVARELGMPSAEYATVCTREGNMVMVRLDGPRPMTLAAMATAATNIGALLFVARECAASLQARLMPLP